MTNNFEIAWFDETHMTSTIEMTKANPMGLKIKNIDDENKEYMLIIET